MTDRKIAEPDEEINRLRELQSIATMEHIPALLEWWEQIPNDAKSYIEQEAPAFVLTMDRIYTAMETCGE